MKLLLKLFLVLFGIISCTEYTKDDHHILAAVVAQNLCSSIFISQRNYSSTPPFIEDLNDGPGEHATIFVNKEKKFVEATSIKYPSISKISRFIDNLRGCAVIRDSIEEIKVNQLKKRNEFKIMESDSIKKLIEEEFQNKEIKTRSILVYHKGVILGEKYADGFSKETKQLVWSVTKSFLNVLFGVAVYQKKLNIDEKISAPEWQENDPRNAMTIRQVLKMTSSLDFKETYGYKSDPSKLVYNSTSMGSFAASKLLKAAPGKIWSYSTGDSSLLSRKLANYFKTREEYWKFPREQLYNKLGISDGSLINVDPSLIFAGGVFGYFTPRDLLRFGLLLLNDGMVNGERILPEGWVKMSTTGSTESNGRYGYQFWIPKSSRIPSTCFSAVGWRKQFVFVCPSLDLIIIRTGLTDTFWNELVFFSKIIEQLK
jgi:CubicO group peptidase (beta-lactamase class C family)